MIRKLTGVDQTINSELAEFETAQQGTVSEATRLGIANQIDAFESTNAVSSDYSNFAGNQQLSISVQQDSFATEKVDASSMFDSIDAIQEPAAPPEELVNNNIVIPDFSRGPLSVPPRSLKSQITSSATSIPSNPPSAFPDPSEVSQDSGGLEGKRLVHSISMPTVVKERLVEDLLTQIKQLLLTVPPDQQSYWENLFEEKMKAHFYQATVKSELLPIFSPDNVRYYPKDRNSIDWEWAMEDFQTLLVQLQTVQQPTGVPVVPPDIPPEG